MTRITFSELERNRTAYFEQVEKDRLELVVTRENREDLVILPRSELGGLHETLHILSSPVNAERLSKSIAELDAGKGVEHDLIDP